MSAHDHAGHEHHGPGYASPELAREQPPEQFVYVAALYEGTGIDRPDFIAVVDVDPESDDLRADRAPHRDAERRRRAASLRLERVLVGVPLAAAARHADRSGHALLADLTSSTSPSRARRGSRT